jgi:hypothetical protein
VQSCASIARRCTVQMHMGLAERDPPHLGHRLATPRMGLLAVPPSWQAAPMALTAPWQ